MEGEAELLLCMDSIDLYDLHMLEEMHRLGPVRSSLRWLGTNTWAETVKARLPKGRYTRLRYEDFVEDPRAMPLLFHYNYPRLPTRAVLRAANR